MQDHSLNFRIPHHFMNIIKIYWILCRSQKSQQISIVFLYSKVATDHNYHLFRRTFDIVYMYSKKKTYNKTTTTTTTKHNMHINFHLLLKNGILRQ